MSVSNELIVTGYEIYSSENPDIDLLRRFTTSLCLGIWGLVKFEMFCLFQFLDCLISGASSGLGLETTRVLALRGVHVVMAVRNTDAGRNVKEEILKEIPTAKIDVMELDLSSMASVRKFASEYNSSGRPLHILM